MTDSIGFAAVTYKGEILIDTVSTTARAAMVNWLVIYGKMMVLNRHSDPYIVDMFLTKAAHKGLAIIELVKIERTRP